MMTEKEAAKKWCPHARVIAVADNQGHVAGNRVKHHHKWMTIDNPDSGRITNWRVPTAEQIEEFVKGED